jgi:hypothetical protein
MGGMGHTGVAQAGVTRWMFVEQIKRYRLRASLTHADMMGIGLGSSARWSRLENHREGVRIRKGELFLIQKAFRLSVIETDELVDLFDRAEYEEVARVEVEPNFREYLAFERYAATIEIMSPGVHGLLQTADYAEAIVRLSGDVEESGIPGVIALRQERQRQTLGRAQLRVTLAEEAVRRRVGSGECMAEQRAHLVRLAEEGLADIRIFLLDAGGLPATRGEATILHFEAKNAPRSVGYLESYLGGAHSDRPRVVADLSRRFAAMFEQSVPIKEYLT